MDSRDYMLVFTTEEGGILAARWSSPTEYEATVANGFLTVGHYDSRPDDQIPVAFAALCRVERDHDFVLGGSRSDPASWTIRKRVTA